MANLFKKAKPFLAVILLQFGYAGMSLISKFALNRGMSPHVLVVYRHALAFLAIAPFALFFDSNIHSCHVQHGSCLCIYTSLDLQTKILGTIVTVGGAVLMTFIKGPILDLPWTESEDFTEETGTSSSSVQNPIKGAIMIIIGCICCAGFIILQANALKTYPTELSLTALICLMGAIEGSVSALIFEHNNSSAWAIHFDYALIAAVYGGVICSGIAYYVQSVLMKSKGPVFVAAFNPLIMVVVAITSSFLLSKMMYLGWIIGGIVIVIGLYLVLWGKSKDELPPSSDSCCDSDRVEKAPSIHDDDDDDDQEMAKISDDQDDDDDQEMAKAPSIHDDNDDPEMTRISDDDHQRTQVSNNQDHQSVVLDHVIIDRPCT
ncbi:hypothetical protein QYF36_003155 [Acer negundo]|nr:hypothetical protein QYF36_003155 [Acer negundo]